jgi:molybdate-binding protein
VRFIHRQSRSADGKEASVAEAVAAGRADAGFGLRADATRHKLAFTPLAIERYFFACAKAALRGAAMKALLDALKSPAFAARVSRLPGYDASQTGRREALDAALTWVGRS